MPSVNLILNFTRTSRYAFNALVGALEAHIRDPRLTITVARKRQDLETLLDEAHEHTSTVMLWSFYSPRFDEARIQLARLKRRVDKPGVVHLAGGVHASAEPLQTLKAGFDFVAVGEGEQIIVDFVRCALQGVSPAKVKGIAYLEDGSIRRNGRGELIDLDDYPPVAPAHRLFGAIEITRGCVYACRFCQTPYVSKARFRHRSVDNIAHYVRIMRAYGFRDFRFISPTSLSYGSTDERVDLDALDHLLAAVRHAAGREARIFYGTFPTEIRPEHVTRAALRLLKQYVDNDNLIIGGQSGSQRVLDASRRGHSVDAVIEAVRLCLDEGFLPNVDLLFGLPGETRDDLEQTLAMAQILTDLGAKVHSHTFMPLPGTPFRDSDAGGVDPAAQQFLRRLEFDGKAYGKWQSQIRTAKDLVRIREEAG